MNGLTWEARSVWAEAAAQKISRKTVSRNFNEILLEQVTTSVVTKNALT
jgi:hypothetical protein